MYNIIPNSSNPSCCSSIFRITFQCHFVSVHEHVLFQSSEGTSCSTRLQIKVAFCNFLHAIRSTLVSGSVRVIARAYTQHCGTRKGSTYEASSWTCKHNVKLHVGEWCRELQRRAPLGTGFTAYLLKSDSMRQHKHLGMLPSRMNWIKSLATRPTMMCCVDQYTSVQYSTWQTQSKLEVQWL